MDTPNRTRKQSKIAASNNVDQEKDTIAIALGNTGDQPESVPRVLATGRGEFAETILDIAFRNGIKVREDTDLAEILSTVDLDSEIPVEAFVAVAEILRYVYASTSENASEHLEQNARKNTSPMPKESDHGPEKRDT